MKGLLVSVLIVSGIVLLFNFPKTSDGQSQTTSCKCVTDALAGIEKIKVGMKRRDLDKMFSVDGGISSITERFVYEKCNFIKVEVKFKFVDKSDKFPKGNPEDEIIEISKPYLEHPFYD
ncbi:MAG TPA: hypothetical protein VNI60_10715 [Pyrinomonadaceae bacterium]|nr:hypothetical protein [Pyrinomonadaceae bacterium]